MLSKMNLSNKRLQIDKANAAVVLAIAVAVFVAIFTIVASRALWSQHSYQNRVSKAKKEARDQLENNNRESEKLIQSYETFLKSPENLIKGNASGSGDRDGDNARLVLDSLPSKYDFPALISSLEKIIASKGFEIESITGTDDELNQSKATDTTQPVDMPFEFKIKGTYQTVKDLTLDLEHSIRPFHLQKIIITAGDNKSISYGVTGKTYYQPEKTPQSLIKTKDIK